MNQISAETKPEFGTELSTTELRLGDPRFATTLCVCLKVAPPFLVRLPFTTKGKRLEKYAH